VFSFRSLLFCCSCCCSSLKPPGFPGYEFLSCEVVVFTLNLCLDLLGGGGWFLLVCLLSLAWAQVLVPVWLVLEYRLYVLLMNDCRPYRTW